MAHQRIASIIADRGALFLDKDHNKLEKRKFTADEIAVKINLDEPVTLKRCAEICKRFDIQNRMRVNDWRYYHPDTGEELSDEVMEQIGEDGGYVTRKKEYLYYPESNTLQIWDEGLPIYENANGVICKDQDALCDCLM